ncbi:hypothetical protein NY2A_B188R [Paramecium bursaria Chlorella virus NY2A]|uniref:Uncharacterized protein B188R n=1 Tax=Paramecium bursaria Chlorella virus NY2A TaxID=46021 RepID=A7IW63_PBCVN|nr:hypothetical protein NY2A_B188R [Paramecium bursaria Chlorella virus NY2A]ABT14587.1 hypothetical protein NY2A_B188R [Paramecium bursaria Chlorella virus NY2A]
MCFGRNKRIQVFEEISYEEFYEKFYRSLFPGTSLRSFIRANRYKRAFFGGMIRPKDFVTIPRSRNDTRVVCLISGFVRPICLKSRWCCTLCCSVSRI